MQSLSRVCKVVFPSTTPRTNPTLQTARKKMANAIRLLRAYTLAPDKDSELVRKYWQNRKVPPELDKEKDITSTDTQRAVSQDGGITFRLKNYTIFAAVARREDLWEAATSRSRWGVRCKRRQRGGKCSENELDTEN